jgi:hypothetical protein
MAFGIGRDEKDAGERSSLAQGREAARHCILHAKIIGKYEATVALDPPAIMKTGGNVMLAHLGAAENHGFDNEQA